MSQLSATNLPENIRTPAYNRDAVTTGIVHFGIGNFHRAHQALYCDDLLALGNTQENLKWGITGISLRSAAMKETLAPQDFLYTHTILGATTAYRIIGAVKNILVAPQTPQAVIDLLAKPATQLVSSTITEKGYYLSSGAVDFDHADLRAEVTSLDTPKTIYGFLARGIIKRSQDTPQDSHAAKMTIMCCDNISGGGAFLKDGVEHLLAIHSPEALAWSRAHIGFISSMVDRVCPATDDKLRAQVLKDTGREDSWPVSAEPFTQWIIETGFVGARPDFDKVGAVFVEDIAPFERMKLRYLNAAHTIASTLGYLSGDTYVHEALERPEVLSFMRKALYENVLPHAAVPQGYDGSSYIEDVITRFQNGNLPYANLQVGTDSSQKIQQRWLPTIDAAIAKNADTSYFEFCLGAWVIFIQTALENECLNDPKAEALKSVTTDDIDANARAYLKIANADQFKFYSDTDFMSAAISHAKMIKTNGVTDSLLGILEG